MLLKKLISNLTNKDERVYYILSLIGSQALILFHKQPKRSGKESLTVELKTPYTTPGLTQNW